MKLNNKAKKIMRVLFPGVMTLSIGVLLLFAISKPMENAILVIEDDYAKAFASAIYAITMLQLVMRFVGFDMVQNFGQTLFEAFGILFED